MLIYYTRQLSMLKIKISHAPTDSNWSMILATSLRDTMLETAYQSDSRKGLTVAARRPGVMLRACARLSFWILYWHRTYFDAAMTPRMRAVISWIRFASVRS